MHVTQDELERALRETFAQQVAAPRPGAADPAGAAIRRARRTQRRRTATGLAMAAVATVVVSAGVGQLGDATRRPAQPPTVVLGDPSNQARPEPLPSPTGVGGPPVAPDAGPDVLLDGAILGADGERVALDGIGPAERAQRLPENAGWLVVGAPTAAGRTLWAIPRGGTPQVLLDGADAIAVATDGRQVAWRDGGEIAAAGLVRTQLIAPVRTPAPAGAVPVGFVGNAVLVRTDPDRPGHALWSPATAPLEAGSDRTTLNVYGVLPDGRLVGQVPGKVASNPCLALLDPSRTLTPVETACGPALSRDGLGAVSPDGRWLLLNGESGKKAGALLVDVSRIGGTPADQPLVAGHAGPPLTGSVAWNAVDEAAYVDESGRLVRLTPDRVHAGEPGEATVVPGADASNRPVVVTGS
ncbi:hypothetical protein [Micromonospora sp. 15K316]|uniref:hypothetical protein n=1 Tax=Micromonospora sp. 15K316 TaxID=2530376 RepID=UPI001A9E6998|nr:hypothetical protein [Micromonospora sp. 15K316]